MARVSIRSILVAIPLRMSCASQVIQFLVRTLSASVGIVIVIGSSFPPFLIAIIPLGWMYSRFMTLVSLSGTSDCILTSLADFILQHHANFNASMRFLVPQSYPGSLSRSLVYPLSAHLISRRFSLKSMNAVSTATRCAIYPAPLLTGGWPCASSLSVHNNIYIVFVGGRRTCNEWGRRGARWPCYLLRA